MNKQVFFKSLEDMPAAEIARRVMEGVATFDEVMSYVTDEDIYFTPAKRKEVKAILEGSSKEKAILDEAVAGEDIQMLEAFVAKYPKSPLIEKAKDKLAEISEKEARARAEVAREKEAAEEGLVDEALRNVNLYTPDAFLDHYNELGYDADGLMRKCCSILNLDYDFVRNYDEPELVAGNIPSRPADIPTGFTDIFFWGMPSSGKTCALSAILNTIKTNYAPTDPMIEKQFGKSYRDKLMYLFRNDCAYLPAATILERTQYMPFRLKTLEEPERYYRNVSFFELSGEIFKYIYDVVNGSDLAGSRENEEKREQKNIAFKTLDLLLNSDNQKIHFFFIDHSAKKQHIEEQEMFLNAATTYFINTKNIFQKKTDAIYIILTKADGIQAIDDRERSQKAAMFLKERFGAFINAIVNQCRRYSIKEPSMKIFSIGDVYFSKICRINRKYSRRIIDELLQHINPARRFDPIDGILS
ncbi:MAG: hypothetical protein LBB74_03970 [Chitinispirillales bacterium]|jgi:hypothetical protein|nr:hypothetical protein [Chitinispirillales bacterium]